MKSKTGLQKPKVINQNSHSGSHSIRPGTIAFVTPRYGPGVIGGAEAVMADMAGGLAERGHPVEVLTTCARDHFSWANEFAETEEWSQGGYLVRRFATQTNTLGQKRRHIGAKILAGQNVTIQDQQHWANDSLRCVGLWHHVFDHGRRYRAIVFGPYMFWTTYAVSQIHPSRSILMPCLHDEPPAYLNIFRSMLESAHATIFLSDPERELAAKLCNLNERTCVVGASITAPNGYNPEAFKQRHGIDQDYIYYAGRREHGKGWSELCSAFNNYRQHRNDASALKLVTSGVGKVDPHLIAQGSVIDLGLLSERDRDDAMAAARAYVQPSALESFSRTVMEAWLAGTPVVANHASAVVRWHIQRSQAGLLYRNKAELVQAINYLSDNPKQAARLAEPGRGYVLQNYDPQIVHDRLEAVIDDWLPPTQTLHPHLDDREILI